MNNGTSEYGWESSEQPQSCGYIGPRVLKLLEGLPDVRKVFDLGCGNGALAGDLVRFGYDAAGLEFDKAGFEIAQRTCPGSRFFNLGVEDDPQIVVSECGFFDAVVSTEVIEHVFRPRFLAQFARNVVKQNGYLILSTPYHGYLKNLALSVLGRWDEHHTVDWDGGHIKFFSRKTLEALLRANGFEPVAFHGVGRLPFLWKSMIIVARAN